MSMLLLGWCRWGNSLGCLHHCCILGGRRNTRGKYWDSLPCSCLKIWILKSLVVTLGKATEHLGGACGQSDRVGEEDFTTSQEKRSLEEDIAAREKVTLNCWGPLDFMARYCVGHFPEISCPFLLPPPPVSLPVPHSWRLIVRWVELLPRKSSSK